MTNTTLTRRMVAALVGAVLFWAGSIGAAETDAAELTDAERLFQGEWQLKSDGSAMTTGTLRIDGRHFSADTIHGEYSGNVSIRPDRSPAQIDFTIEGCDCKFEGKVSTGIYYEDDGTIVFATPSPGEPRPTAFAGLDKTKFMIVRATRVVEGDTE